MDFAIVKFHHFSPFFTIDTPPPLRVLMGTDIKNVLGENNSHALYELFHRLQNAYQAAHESIRSKQGSSKDEKTILC